MLQFKKKKKSVAAAHPSPRSAHFKHPTDVSVEWQAVSPGHG